LSDLAHKAKLLQNDSGCSLIKARFAIWLCINKSILSSAPNAFLNSASVLNSGFSYQNSNEKPFLSFSVSVLEILINYINDHLVESPIYCICLSNIKSHAEKTISNLREKDILAIFKSVY